MEDEESFVELHFLSLKFASLLIFVTNGLFKSGEEGGGGGACAVRNV